MILKSLKLTNYRKFKDTLIEFPDGVTGVVGLNGVGKSTIFEAVAWILYGSVAARTSATQIKRQGAKDKDPCRGELEFIFEEDIYRIVREMSGKNLTVSSTATVNGKVAATSAESVNKFIQKKLGMDFKSFFTSIFAKQKELNTLSSMNASERRPLILRMLGIDSLDEVIKEIKNDKKEKDKLINQLSQVLVDESGKEKINLFTDQIKNLKEEKEKIENNIKKIKEGILKDKKLLKNIEKNYIDKKNDYEKINKKKEDLSEKKTIFENKNKLNEEIKDLEKRISEREDQIKKENKKLLNFKKLDEDIKKNQKRLKESESKNQDIIKKIEQKKTLIEKIKEDISKIEDKQKKISKIGPKAKCPTCQRVLSDQYDILLKKFDLEKEDLSKKKELLSNENNDFDIKREIIRRENEALNKKQGYLQRQLREKEKINTTIINFTSELKKENNQLKIKNDKVNKIGKISFDKKLFEKLKRDLDSYYLRYQNSLDDLNKKKEYISNQNLELERKQGDKKLLLNEISNLKDKITQLKKSKDKIKEEKTYSYYLGMLSEVMSSFRTHLISRIRPTLSMYSSDFFKQLTNGKYSELELDENYNLLIYDNGEAYSVERFSGGEEDLANLCLRLSISEIITERAGGVFNFIILDEIFGSQDMYRRKNIMNALNSLSSKFRQIFLITHIEDLKNDMENIIFVNEKENNESEVKVE